MRLVIVESPTKAKTIDKFLGKDFKVTSSYGHIRDLPKNAAEIPEKVKIEKWTRIGVNVDENFSPLYVIPDAKKKHVAELKRLVKDADELLLATDEDREGESISWHLLEVLSPKVPVKRLVFHEITKEAIEHAVASPRDIDFNLVKAQETRRIIDRLYGYTVSPLLWKKMRPKLSAGRVQSVAMRLLVERERQRISFKNADYWDLKASFKKTAALIQSAFEAELTHVDDKRIAIGKDFDPNTGLLTAANEVVHLNEKSALELKQSLENKPIIVQSVESKPYSSKPYPPFTTSTLQQEGSRKLRFSASKTMSVAQTLYENGFITYMRTDSTTLSQEALSAARSEIKRLYGNEYLPAEPRLYKTKVRNAQEAHEAIRPAGSNFTAPEDVRNKLGPEAFRLYELIWMRTMASQMKDASGTRVTVQIRCESARFRASGKTIEFPGYLRAYVEGTDDPDAELADQEKILPALSVDEKLDMLKLDALGHTTQPPARYTEGSLIKELERLGIGRPSTWATIVSLVLSRDYAFKRGTALVPTFLATALTGLMERYFTNLVDYGFTAALEDDLDSISRGEADNLKYLNKFYFGNGHPGLKNLVSQGEATIDPRDVCGIALGTLDSGRQLEVRIGRFGPFVSDGTIRASLPEIIAPDELDLLKAEDLLKEAEKGPKALGVDPDSGKNVYVKVGRFGPYVQLGELDKESKEKPKMASLLAGMLPESVTLEIAQQLLTLPRTLGKHPDTGEDIIAANGRYGPYVKSANDTRSIPADSSPISITFEQALELLRQPKQRARRGTVQALKDLGKNPVTDLSITVRSGRFGPYVTDGKVNASLPKGTAIEALTLEDAINLLELRSAKLAEDAALVGGDLIEEKPKKAKKSPKEKKEKIVKEKVKKKKGKTAKE